MTISPLWRTRIRGRSAIFVLSESSIESQTARILQIGDTLEQMPKEISNLARIIALEARHVPELAMDLPSKNPSRATLRIAWSRIATRNFAYLAARS
jgi:hypothetical protein